MKTIIENAIAEERKSFIEEITNREDFGFESAESMLDDVESEDSREGAIRYQAFLSGIHSLNGRFDKLTDKEILLAMMELATKLDERCDDHIDYNERDRTDLSEEELVDIIKNAVDNFISLS